MVLILQFLDDHQRAYYPTAYTDPDNRTIR
jgi:hypothetical protein